MIKCRIVHTAGPEGPPYFVHGPMVSYAQCETHGLALGRGPYSGELCPVGRIEQAVEDGLARIEAAIRTAHANHNVAGPAAPRSAEPYVSGPSGLSNACEQDEGA